MKRTNGRGPKDKGKAYEREIVASILAAFPQLSPNDVLARSMGDPGADVILSEAARQVLPLAIECKRVRRAESLNLPGALLQAQHNAQAGMVPVVVYREDRHQSIAALWLSDLIRVLMGQENDGPQQVVSLSWIDLLRLFGGFKNDK